VKLLVAAYLLTLAPSLAVPALHERCDDDCHAHKLAREAEITSNYRVAREQQIKRDRERLALLYIEQARIARMIERTKKGKL
jgi:hypothetical protein